MADFLLWWLHDRVHEVIFARGTIDRYKISQLSLKIKRILWCVCMSNIDFCIALITVISIHKSRSISYSINLKKLTNHLQLLSTPNVTWTFLPLFSVLTTFCYIHSLSRSNEGTHNRYAIKYLTSKSKFLDIVSCYNPVTTLNNRCQVFEWVHEHYINFFCLSQQPERTMKNLINRNFQ